MASDTIELRRYIEAHSQYVEGLSTRERIEIGRTKLFDFPYPLFSEDFRKDFETNVIRKFYFREIGFETIGRFKFELENWLLINMPFYNKMFESELLEYDPLTNIKTIRDNSFDNKKDRNDNIDRSEDIKTNKEGKGLENTKDDGTFTQDGTSDTNVKQDTNSTSTNDVDTSTTKNENTSKNSTRNGSENNNGSSEGFQRDLKSDTPDNRLGITTEDGKGVIEYASEIDESFKKDSSKSDTTSKDEVEETGNLDGTGTNKTTEKGTGEDHTTGESKGKTHNEGTTSATGKKDRIETEEVTTGKTGNDKLNSLIKENQNFNETMYGKTGAMTYQEMVMLYRDTFLRIEDMIHQEMNKKLFMLVYN
ncbi:adaptor Ad4 [Bacillus phage Harambe]|uniref:Lower collar protein n=1 Tax=Bacillus phage Harambe TaxID=1981931 RepID=A0A1W6JSC3_9CAUD|nr:adaptor Ad4 [Bacillus phage Harambe]ARM70171.1 lower collar protein [Bacillus phage Harambe]